MKRFLLALLVATVALSPANAQTPAPQQAAAKPQLGPNQWTADPYTPPPTSACGT